MPRIGRTLTERVEFHMSRDLRRKLNAWRGITGYNQSKAIRELIGVGLEHHFRWQQKAEHGEQAELASDKG